MEKRRRRPRTPRATQPVWERRFSRSMRIRVVSRKVMFVPQYKQNFSNFSNVTHALSGINET